MDRFLSNLTHHAMSYAIRSGIAITSTYAITQCSRLLKTVDNKADRHELQELQRRLDSKIRIISPAIDMIELISARGNTSLESAVSLTRTLRWEIQSLGVRINRAANTEELSQRAKTQAKTRAQHEIELKAITCHIRNLLARIEDAVPLINLAITTSGANLSTSLPGTVSPSRLLQASTFLTAGDHQYSQDPNLSVCVGPTFYLSLYMLFSSYGKNKDEDGNEILRERATTWTEVVHKAQVKLVRVPLSTAYGQSAESGGTLERSTNLYPRPSIEGNTKQGETIAGDSKANEFAYQLDIIEDLDDGRVHDFEGASQPTSYQGVSLAGIRETFPIHQISKIFYADSGKLLNINGDGETNTPVLLLKRDINAQPPRRMMHHTEQEQSLYDEPEGSSDERSDSGDSQHDIDEQLRRESNIHVPTHSSLQEQSSDAKAGKWRFPSNLDSEWLALEVYSEQLDDSSEDDQSASEDAAYVSGCRTSSAGLGSNLTDKFQTLDVADDDKDEKSKSNRQRLLSKEPQVVQSRPETPPPTQTSFGPVRTSLSLLEMLIRLTSLQQFQQAPHLSIPDELLTFFLRESSTTGAGRDAEERRRKRWEARYKVGFDPYDESPIKARGEEYQYQEGKDETERNRIEYDDYDTPDLGDDSRGYHGDDNRRGFPLNGRQWSKERGDTSQDTPEPWLPRSRMDSDRTGSSRAASGRYFREDTPSKDPGTPLAEAMSPVLARKANRKFERKKENHYGGKQSSPLRRSRIDSDETDSSLGTSPAFPGMHGSPGDLMNGIGRH